CMNVVFMDRRFLDLARLVSNPSDLGGIAGDPGWIIERRKTDAIEGYESWPADCQFRAFVDPDSFELTHPEFFCDEQSFHAFIQTTINNFYEMFPGQDEQFEFLLKKLLYLH
ncbi:MAG: hypothetical protein ACRYGK_16120, partial [Janthinobacterium lividum]